MCYTRSSVQLEMGGLLAFKLDTTSVTLYCKHVLHVYATQKHLNQKNSFASASHIYLECEIMRYKKDVTETHDTEAIMERLHKIKRTQNCEIWHQHLGPQMIEISEDLPPCCRPALFQSVCPCLPGCLPSHVTNTRVQYCRYYMGLV